MCAKLCKFVPRVVECVPSSVRFSLSQALSMVLTLICAIYILHCTEEIFCIPPLHGLAWGMCAKYSDKTCQCKYFKFAALQTFIYCNPELSKCYPAGQSLQSVILQGRAFKVYPAGQIFQICSFANIHPLKSRAF